MKNRRWIVAAAFVVLAAVGGLWAASGRADAWSIQKPALDCCFDPTCPPGCKPTCPLDCTVGAKDARPQAKSVEGKNRGHCPPCVVCP